jgi:hypothetical protein
MGTEHPTDKERQAIQYSAIHGDESARNYLELIDACTQLLENTNGISAARGMVGEHNDIYGQAIDDALADLMPVIYKISANGWESLKYYVPREARKSKGTKNPRERQDSAEQKAQEARRQADFLKARQRQAENQEYLQQAIREVSESGDPAAEASVTLNYHQAMLQALMHLTRGTDCPDQNDIDALAETANDLDIERSAYAADPASFGIPEMQAFIAECISKLGLVKNLCLVCHERMQYDMLENFRSIQSAWAAEREAVKTVHGLLKKLPANYPPAQFEKTAYGYMLQIDRTIIFQKASAEDAVKHTTNYVEAREGHPDLPIGVIYGLYD